MKPLASVLVATAAAAILALAYNTVVARQLGPIAYAEFATALAAATMLAYAGGSLAPITAHLSARYMAAGDPAKIRGLVSTLLRRLVPLLIAGAVVCAISAASIARAFHFESALSIVAAYCVLAGLLVLSIARSASRGAQQFGRFGAGVAGEGLIRLAAGVALLALWPQPAAALAAYFIALIVTFAATLHGLRLLAPHAAPVPRADVTGMLGATAVLVIAMGAFQNIDILVVKRSFAPAEAGIYAAAWSFGRWMALVAFPIEALLLPRLSFEGEQGRSVTSVAMRLGGSMLLMAAVPLAAFVLVPSQIVTTLYGPNYEDAAPLLFYLGLAAFLQYACYLIVQVSIARAHTWPLAVFAAAGIAETAIIIGRHDSLHLVATVLVTMRLGTLVTLVAGIWAATRTIAVPQRA